MHRHFLSFSICFFWFTLYISVKLKKFPMNLYKYAVSFNDIVMLKCFLNFQNDYKFKMALKYLRLKTEKNRTKIRQNDRANNEIKALRKSTKKGVCVLTQTCVPSFRSSESKTELLPVSSYNVRRQNRKFLSSNYTLFKNLIPYQFKIIMKPSNEFLCVYVFAQNLYLLKFGVSIPSICYLITVRYSLK